ncbi:hypothetical protein C8Q76DRAFT_606088 [Earliella scabrosa]|nr:hypothetical protein C8Q76DRAFT_606088 [Earliella scabrosa]
MGAEVSLRAIRTPQHPRGLLSYTYPDTPLVPRLCVDVCIAILQLLDLNELASVRGTSTLADAYGAAVLGHRTRHLLEHFCQHPESVLDALLFSCSVLGGMTSSHLLYPNLYPTCDVLHIYTPRALFFHMIGYLTRCERYTYELHAPSSAQLPSALSVAVLKKGDLRIEITVSRSDCPLEPLANLSSTALVTYLSPTEIGVAYPASLAAQRMLLHPRSLTEDLKVPEDWKPELRTLHSNGWKIATRLSARRDEGRPCRGRRSAECAAALRYLGDRHCLQPPLHPRGAVLYRPHVDLVREYTVLWWRGGKTCAKSCASGEREIESSSRTVPRSVLRRT